MARFWFDCEFIEDGTTIELISIGIVAEDGRTLYRVNSDAPWDRIKANDWLAQNVLPWLPLHNFDLLKERIGSKPNVHPRPSIDLVTIDRTNSNVRPKWVIANEVRDFIAIGDPDRANNELWAYYSAYDHVALCQLWGTMVQLPDAVPMYTNDLMQLWNQAGRPKLPENFGEHDALADAQWNQQVWQTCQPGSGTSQNRSKR